MIKNSVVSFVGVYLTVAILLLLSIPSLTTADETKKVDFVQVLSFDQETPATLKAGEKLGFSMRYRLDGAKSCLVWTRPYIYGSVASGWVVHPPLMQECKKGAGQLKGWVRFDGPGQMDEIQVQLVNAETKEVLAQVVARFQAKWIETSK